MDIRGKLTECFERLQGLDIKPTLTNMEALVQTLYDLREIYNELGKGDRDGRGPEADPGGRDDD